jgi:hypothetical protein
LIRIETFDGGHRPASDAAYRRDAGDACGAVDPHRAATALALRTTAVLDRMASQLLAERIE